MALVLTLTTILYNKRISNGVVTLSIRKHFLFHSLTFQQSSYLIFFSETANTAPQTICLRPSSVCNVLQTLSLTVPCE